MSPKHAIAACCSCSSTPVRTSETKEPGDGKDNAKAARIDEQVTREIGDVAEGEEFTMVSCPTPPPMASQPMSTTWAPAKASTPSTASRSTLTTPYTPNSTVNLHQGPMLSLPRPISIPHSFANVISPCSAHFPPNRQHPQHSTSTVPFRSLSIAQK